MRTKGKASRRLLKVRERLAYDTDDDIVGENSSDLIPKITPQNYPCHEILGELPVKRDIVQSGGRRYSPYEKSDPNLDGYVEQNVYSKFEELRDFKYSSEKVDIKCSNEDRSVTRDEVKKIVKLYREILHNLLRENDKSIAKMPNIHQKAAMILRNSHSFLNKEKRLGSVPGVEIGDEFQFRVELYIIGLHHQFEKGIDYMEKDGSTLATSIVSTSRYSNSVNSDVLIYLGEGGNPMVRSQHHLKDQVLKRGNLALKNSMERKTPVRVILKGPFDAAFVYVGLYLVEKWRKARGQFHKLVFKFELRRISGQPRLGHGFIGKLNEYLLRKKGLIVNDISRGKEKIPIVVVNTFDDERPSPFTYVANTTFPTIPNESISSGCDCDDGCSDSEDCSCKVKNGGEFAYDYNERVVKKRPFTYECGSCCKCFDSCINRVSQRGIQFQLEVFKTELKGWGVRSKTCIPAGSFVCEYVGEILKLKEAKQNSNGNQCFFLMGNYKYDGKIGDVSSSEDDEVFVIDATQRGNVGRFINHSCSPNLYVQSVFIGDGSKMSHVMLFAMKDIAPFEELTYDYKCRLGKFGRRNLNAMEKNCCCESPSCVRKFY